MLGDDVEISVFNDDKCSFSVSFRFTIFTSVPGTAHVVCTERNITCSVG
jgi:hypothetical protein